VVFWLIQGNVDCLKDARQGRDTGEGVTLGIASKPEFAGRFQAAITTARFNHSVGNDVQENSGC
jgi:hypothetical protein